MSLNFGIRRGFNKVANPRVANEFNSPSSPWTYRTPTYQPYYTNSWDFVTISTNSNVFLPSSPSKGDIVVLYLTDGPGAVVAVFPGSGHNIGGATSRTIAPPASSSICLVSFQYLGSGIWVIFGAVGTDGAQGFLAEGVITANAGTITPGTYTSPSLGAAAQVSTVNDVELYIQITTAGQLTIAVGPTSGVSQNILSATAVTAGQLITIRLAKGQYIAVTSSSTAAWTTTGQLV